MTLWGGRLGRLRGAKIIYLVIVGPYLKNVLVKTRTQENQIATTQEISALEGTASKALEEQALKVLGEFKLEAFEQMKLSLFLGEFKFERFK